jgi:hypothetical protein
MREIQNKLIELGFEYVSGYLTEYHYVKLFSKGFLRVETTENIINQEIIIYFNIEDSNLWFKVDLDQIQTLDKIINK